MINLNKYSKIVCAYCKKDTTIYTKNINLQKYCDRKCFTSAQVKPKVQKCQYCKKEVGGKNHAIRTCFNCKRERNRISARISKKKYTLKRD